MVKRTNNKRPAAKRAGGGKAVAGVKTAAAQRPASVDREMRRVAAVIRAGGKPTAPAALVRLAEMHLRNRQHYNERRARVRALAAQVRAGKKPRIPKDLVEAVANHLAYREWYNADRMRQRRARARAQAAAGRS